MVLSVWAGNTVQAWRSSLYPAGWEPGYSDAAGRFLHDFSYAGYASGLKEIPTIASPLVDITQAPYHADNTGATDVTALLQQAINDLPATGGVVYLPAGEYRLSVPSDRAYGILINKNNVVIRGAGAEVTKIKNTSSYMRSKALFSFLANSADWTSSSANTSLLLHDTGLPTNEVAVENTDLFQTGDWVVLRTDVTDAFIEEHHATGYWSGSMKGIMFCRKILAVNAYTKTLTLDAPTRYPVKRRDNARVVKLKAQLLECGMEDLSIGNIQHSGSGFGDSDFNISGTAAYDVHASHLIAVRNAINCWFRGIKTYRPAENAGNFHCLSNCLQIIHSRHVTVENCDFRCSQYEGGGGNGYMYILQGNDCLVKNCYAEDGRHNYDFKGMASNGNVIYGCTTRNPRLTSDFHMHLSMANLFDNFRADGDIIEAGFRTAGYEGAVHMYTTSESVIWNTTGINPMGDRTYVVVSRQFGNGYVIGTSGTPHGVASTPYQGIHSSTGIPYNTAPQDFTEGIGTGASLEPASLWLDQSEKRRNRPGFTPTLPALDIDFEDYLLNERYNAAGSRVISSGASITSQVVENPDKSGLNTSNKVLRIDRAENTSISPTAVTNRGILTDSYDIAMNAEYCILELKVLKTAAGRLAARLNTDYNAEVSTAQTAGSTEWQTVRFDFSGKINWSLREDARLIIQIEKASSPASYQTGPLTVYIDDIRLISKNATLAGRLSKHINISYLYPLQQLKISNPGGAQAVSVSILDTTGKEVLRKTVVENEGALDLSGIKQGAYFVECKKDKTIVAFEKIIVK
jgi:hypothetical protein